MQSKQTGLDRHDLAEAPHFFLRARCPIRRAQASSDQTGDEAVNQEVPMHFALLFRKSTDPKAQPSPTEMQEGYARWQSWMSKYSKEILAQSPPRSGPKPGGASAVCRGGAVTDGPYVEGKEIVAGWSFIQADSMQRAIEVAKEVPMFNSVEIIEIQSF
jgi:hypothetical protein